LTRFQFSRWSIRTTHKKTFWKHFTHKYSSRKCSALCSIFLYKPWYNLAGNQGRLHWRHLQDRHLCTFKFGEGLPDKTQSETDAKN